MERDGGGEGFSLVKGLLAALGGAVEVLEVGVRLVFCGVFDWFYGVDYLHGFGGLQRVCLFELG